MGHFITTKVEREEVCSEERGSRGRKGFDRVPVALSPSAMQYQLPLRTVGLTFLCLVVALSQFPGHVGALSLWEEGLEAPTADMELEDLFLDEVEDEDEESPTPYQHEVIFIITISPSSSHPPLSVSLRAPSGVLSSVLRLPWR